LIKAALSVYHQVIPPATGHHEAHPALHGDSSAMHLPDRARLWPADGPVRAGVSAMGSGGVNTHVAIEEAAGRQRRTGLGKRTEAVVSGRQDAELLLLDAPDTAHLRDRLARLAGLVPKLALAELADLAGLLATQLSGQRFRAALVVTDQEDAQRKLARLLDMIDSGQRGAVAMHDGLFLASRATPPKIAYLFPGQGCGRGTADAIRRRFAVADGVFRTFRVPTGDHQDAREVTQPRIVASSVAALRVLESVGVDAHIAVGHSLGELTALCWAGAMGGAQLLRLASARGQIMAQESRGGGGMASLATGPVRARDLIDGGGVVIAAYNAPQQTVISGIAADVDRVCVRAQSDGVQVTRIDVAHAFHSPLVRPVADVMAERLAELRFAPLRRSVVSTVTGELLDPATDLRDLLRGQVVRPVRFHQAAATAVSDVDLAIEIGPGRVLTGLLDQIAPGKPVVSVDTDDRSLSRLLSAVGAAYAFGVPVDTAVLFAGRVVRPLPDELAAAACPVEDASGAASVIDGVHRFVAEPATPAADPRGIHAVDVSSTSPDRAVDDAA
jgi:enediyne polyketide synthase